VPLIVFDLDGTLIDSRRDLADATNALLEDLGAAPLDVEAVARMVGEGAATLVRRALSASGIDPETPGALDRFLVHYNGRLLVHTQPYDGIPGALETLGQRCPLAVLTNKPAAATMTILEGLKLSRFFRQVVGGDTAFGRKPDPSGLLELIRQAGATPATTVLVGDSPIDRETARRAGARICLVRYGFGFTFAPEDLSGGELTVDRAADLPHALEPSLNLL